MTHGLHVGDRIAHTPEPDRRNWWERHAPYWAGGKIKPLNLDGWIIASVTSSGVDNEFPDQIDGNAKFKHNLNDWISYKSTRSSAG
jgi:hypothetical protein